ncbi:MAG: zinc metalloprotease HtpX [Gammaproteobacteria bacterium]|nr:zinc metalloprotease HtpX [Gammaproteobacteria bacterium]
MINRLTDNALRMQNHFHTILIFVGMVALLSAIGLLFGGAPGALFAFFMVIFSLVITPRLSPSLLLKIYGAQALSPYDVPGVYEAVQELSARAGLKSMPDIYYLPSPVVNSFTIGEPNEAKIILSDGLFRLLDSREMLGVLAHEIGHIQNNDISVMGLADIMSRITSVMSLTGLIMLFVSMPLILINELPISFLGILLLTFAPNIAALLQMALSRTREFSADQRAAELTGDPLGLANALEKINWQEQHWARRLLIPHYRLSEPSLLRTHPSSEERIKRLKVLAQIDDAHITRELDIKSGRMPIPEKKPRHRIHGMWY